MAKSDIFGWDLLFKVTQQQIRNNQDVLICLVHWKLIREGFKCVGVGEDTTQPNREEMSETLPEGWNAANKYSLRYVHNGKLYLLIATLIEGNVIINMNRICDNHASGTCINTNVVQVRTGSLDKIIPTYDEVIKKTQTELINPMFENVPSKDTCTQTPAQTQDTTNPLLEPRRSNIYVPQRQPSLPSFGNPFGVGRSDLDPFAPPGGGMLFQPPGFGSQLPGPPIDPMLPPGSVPPGARYDPIRPLGGGPRITNPRNPDHDHLPPPGYNDMFM